MTEIVCMRCGHLLTTGEVPAPAPGELQSITCEVCGLVTSYRVGSPAGTSRVVLGPVSQQQPAPPSQAGDGGAPPLDLPGGFSTLFQPGALAATEPPANAGEGTRLLSGQPPPPDLPPGQGGYFLVLGAAPATARIALRSARTVFGRGEADVDLADAAVSARHFQVEVAGAEIYIRDLQSRNGTFVNGRRVRYAELRPGDEVLAGSTYMVYRGWDDGLGGTATPSPG
jgi:hypothetical protein